MKEIRLTNGYIALVDDNDFDLLNQWSWRGNKQNNGAVYAETDNYVEGKRIVIKMHRFIVGVSDSTILVDHKDGNGLNNQRNNLRPCSKSQNGMNRGTIRKNRLSKFKGVQWHKAGKKWVSEIVVNKKKTYLGLFINEEDAAKDYEIKSKELHGEFSKLNFT
jgi:hypothetical protein